MNHDTIIIGGGLAGLSCGLSLVRQGRNPLILEATDDVGGRVRTDRVDGFLLDRGFQVLLTAYPTCQQLLDYPKLDLQTFQPGAQIRQRGRFRTLGDPWRRPGTAVATLTNPVGSIGDKLRIARARRVARRGSLQDVYNLPDVPTIDYLRDSGFSEKMIDEFFRPFIGGVFLDSSLSVSRRMFDFVFRFFATGDVAIPSTGMAAIPAQLGDNIGRQRIKCHRSVAAIEEHTVHCSGGESYSAENIVIATEASAAARLLTGSRPQQAAQSPMDHSLPTEWKQTINLYFALDRGRGNNRTLMLAGDEPGPIQTAAVISDVASQYAPENKTLISVSLSAGGDDEIAADHFSIDDALPAVASQLAQWLAVRAEDLRFIRVYPIPYGVPARSLDPVLQPIAVNGLLAKTGKSNFWLAGDHRATPSIEGAMSTGCKVAKGILQT